MVGRAWVFRCDGCSKVEMVYTESRSPAVHTAVMNGWTVNGKMCYCKDCSLKRLGRTL